MATDLAPRIEEYFRKTRPAWRDFKVHDIARIHGGASRETFRLVVRYAETGAQEVTRGLILRRDPVSTLIETERAVEFAAYRAFWNSGVPVPEALILEPDPSHLDRPFFVMQEIVGAKAASILAADPYAPHQAAIGAQFFGHLGQIAGADIGKMDLPAAFARPTPGDAWKAQLTHWEKVVDEDELEPQPVVRAAIRWMKAHPPPPAQKISFVHGDYRTGNFLYTDDGRIAAILDWEMAHLGDPLEDLAWALDPLWAHHNPARPAGLCDRAAAIGHWERESGLRADPAGLRWWEMFASLKGAAIWISSAKEYQSGTNTDPVMAFSGLYCLPYHNQVLADRLRDMATEARA
jgi:aminoglycoside phosphotransferase (APT) family kinase protein